VLLLHNGIEEFHILINKTYGCAVDRKDAGKRVHLTSPLHACVRVRVRVRVRVPHRVRRALTLG
jgi:hypothetical protein